MIKQILMEGGMEGHIDDMFTFIENEVAPMYVGSTAKSSQGTQMEGYVSTADSDNIIDQTLGDLMRIGGKLSLSHVCKILSCVAVVHNKLLFYPMVCANEPTLFLS